MKLHLADWAFRVDREATMDYTLQCSLDHCLCAYCRNFYQAADGAHPTLRPFLDRFGAILEGPCEVMPLEPTWILACYRITGEILRHGNARMHADGIPLHFEPSENGTFLLWIGALELPWLQNEAAEDVVSPANTPEFLERMERKWAQLNESDWIFS